MNHRLLFRQIVGLASILCLLVGCASNVLLTATPTSCTGWECTLKGVVYVDAASPGNELAGTVVELSHFSNCAPTSGQHETITGPNGEFEFEVYVHDTDMFRIQIEQDGYEAVRQSVAGFDCLFCTCPLFEIVLQPLGATTPAPYGKDACPYSYRQIEMV